MSSSSSSYDFYRSIGSPKFVSAPMVDQSELAWRLLVKRNGADLAFSQMMHARNFQTDPKYRRDCIDWRDYAHNGWNGSVGTKGLDAEGLDKNLIVQLAGDDPDVLVKAGRWIQNDKNVAAVDLNLGCPQKIAKRGHYGAYLLPEKELVTKLLSSLVKGLDIPVTCKIRRLKTDEETLELVQAIEKTGVSMLTIHGRTVESSKLFTGPVDWDIIKKVKGIVKIPVIANGGIESYSDALRCMEETGVDGVMSSEGLLENPKLFSEEGDRAFRENYIQAQFSTMDEYLAIVQSYPLPSPLYQVVRSHMFKILYRFIDARKNSDLRLTMAKGTFQEMISCFNEMKIRMETIRSADGTYDIELAVEKGLLGPTTWYWRHRDERASQRVLSTPRNALTMKFGANTTKEVTQKELKERLKEKMASRIAAASKGDKKDIGYSHFVHNNLSN